MTAEERITELADWIVDRSDRRLEAPEKLLVRATQKLQAFWDAATVAEQADIGVLCANLTRIYDWATQGRVSKPFTDAQAVIEIAEQRLDEEEIAAVREAIHNDRVACLAEIRDLIRSDGGIGSRSIVDHLADHLAARVTHGHE